MVNSVGKAGRVLELFSGEAPEWGVREAANRLSMPRSTAHEMLTSLTDIGLLRRTERGRYRLDAKVLALSQAYLESSEVRVRARTTVRAVAGRFGVTVHLAALSKDSVIYLDKVRGHDSDPVALSGVGRRLPPHCSAVGKVLLAHIPSGRAVETLESTGMPRYTRRTITSLPGLLDELEGVRARGFAEDREEAVDGLTCFAAPILDADRRVSAAISISIPASRAQSLPERFPRLVMAAGSQISRELRRGPGAARAGDAV
jgi:IclR family transcriptional regulator, KDG regulon repressor